MEKSSSTPLDKPQTNTYIRILRIFHKIINSIMDIKSQYETSYDGYILRFKDRTIPIRESF